MDDWWTWIALAIGALGLSLGIKGTVKFDVNEWLKERRRQREDTLRALCPHAQFSQERDKLHLHVAYVSPPGTVAWQCQMCGHVTYDRHEINQVGKYWSENPQELVLRNQKVERIAKKLGRIV